MRAGKIPFAAAGNIATPEDASFVFLFADSTSGELSYKKSDASVVVTNHP